MEGGAAIVTCQTDGPITWVHNEEVVVSELTSIVPDSILVEVSKSTTGYYVCYKIVGSTIVKVGVSRLESSGEELKNKILLCLFLRIFV